MSYVYIVYVPKGVRRTKPIDFLILNHEAEIGEEVLTPEGNFKIAEFYGRNKIGLNPVSNN